MKINTLLIVLFILFCSGCSAQKTPTSTLPAATQTVAQDATILKKQVDTLKSMNDFLLSAINYSDILSKDIVQSINYGIQALQEAAGAQPVTTTIQNQHLTLIDAQNQNLSVQKQLKALQDINKQLVLDNTLLTTDNKSLSTNLDKAQKQYSTVVDENSKLKDAKTKAENEKLLTYFSISIVLLVLGIAGALWIPAPAKIAGYIVATVGGLGIATTLLFLTYLALIKWILLGAFILGIVWVAYQLIKTHGALTSTASGVQGLKEDLQSGGTELKALYTKYFGDENITGIFSWLHAECEKVMKPILDKVKKL